MTFIVELLIAFFLIVSGIFGFVGSFGMIKLNDPNVPPARADQGNDFGGGWRACWLRSPILFFWKESCPCTSC